MIIKSLLIDRRVWRHDTGRGAACGGGDAGQLRLGREAASERRGRAVGAVAARAVVKISIGCCPALVSYNDHGPGQLTSNRA